MDKPAVSVCIPTYCRHELLRRALASALAQDFAPMEIIVSDNASQDGGWEETRKLRGLDPRIVVRRNSENLGWTGNLNECIKAARGKYLVFLCDDDELMPGMISAAYDFMEEHPGAGMVHTAAYYVGLTGRRRAVTPEIKPYLAAGEEALLHTAFSFNVVFSSAMVRAECFRELGGFVDSASSDYEMWCRLAARYGVGYIKLPLVCVYVHAISPKMTVERYVSGSERLESMVMRLFPAQLRGSAALKLKGRAQTAGAMRSLGVQALQAGYWKNGLAFLKAAGKYSPGYGMTGYWYDVLRSIPRRILFLVFSKRSFETHV